MILTPGSTLGILGSGQLGRMLALTARRMGYRVAVLSPDADSPAGQVADYELTAAYDDEDALARLAELSDVVTVEFENIPARALEFLSSSVPVRPGPPVLHTTQNRLREKRFLASRDFPHARFLAASDESQLRDAAGSLGMSVIVKSAGFGYDGKGQVRVMGDEDLDAAVNLLEMAGEVVVEQVVAFERELSVLVARGPDGDAVTIEPIENRHVGGILDMSLSPAECSAQTALEARNLAVRIAAELEMVGVLAVEFFEVEGGELYVNEIAPRPHNSGHLTIEAAVVDQFELQLRAVTGLPLPEPEPLRPAVMANLLGDLWSSGEPRWKECLVLSGVKLHLYGKGQARPGRKMGHLTAVGQDRAAAEAIVGAARDALTEGSEMSRRT